LALFIVTDEEIPEELLAVLGPHALEIQDGRPLDIAERLLRQSRSPAESWSLVTLSPPDAGEVEIFAGAVREAIANGNACPITLDEYRLPLRALQEIAHRSRSVVVLTAIFRADQDATWE